MLSVAKITSIGGLTAHVTHFNISSVHKTPTTENQGLPILALVVKMAIAEVVEAINYTGHLLPSSGKLSVLSTLVR